MAAAIFSALVGLMLRTMVAAMSLAESLNKSKLDYRVEVISDFLDEFTLCCEGGFIPYG
jgi:hypothetical protein